MAIKRSVIKLHFRTKYIPCSQTTSKTDIFLTSLLWSQEFGSQQAFYTILNREIYKSSFRLKGEASHWGEKKTLWEAICSPVTKKANTSKISDIFTFKLNLQFKHSIYKIHRNLSSFLFFKYCQTNWRTSTL